MGNFVIYFSIVMMMGLFCKCASKDIKAAGTRVHTELTHKYERTDANTQTYTEKAKC